MVAQLLKRQRLRFLASRWFITTRSEDLTPAPTSIGGARIESEEMSASAALGTLLSKLDSAEGSGEGCRWARINMTRSKPFVFAGPWLRIEPGR